MSISIESAIILAAGLGTRMRPLTLQTPKPLIEVAGKKLLDYAVELVESAGIARLVVNTSYLAEQVELHLIGKSAVQISHETVPLETGGGIAKALPLLNTTAPFIAINSDTICLSGNEHPIHRMASHWHDGLDALLLLHPREKAVGYQGKGDFFCSGEGDLRRRGDASDAPLVFTGVQLLHPRLFEGCPHGAFSMNVLYDKLQQADGRFSRLKGIVHDGEWLHIGTPQELAEAERYLAT